MLFIPIRASATILPSARQVCVRLPPLPVRASALPQLLFALPSLLRVRSRERQVPPNPNSPTSPSARRQLLFALPCVRFPLTRPERQLLSPPSTRQVRYPTFVSPSVRCQLFWYRLTRSTIPSSARQVLPIPHPRVRPNVSVRYPPIPIPASALTRGVRVPSARRLLSSGAPTRTSATIPCVTTCLPRVRYRLTRSSIPSSARQVPPHPHPRDNPLSDPCVSHFPRPAVPCVPIRASATLSPLPRVRCAYAPFSRVKPFSHVTALARVLTAIVRLVARQVPPDPIRASATIPPLPRSACQLPSHLEELMTPGCFLFLYLLALFESSLLQSSCDRSFLDSLPLTFRSSWGGGLPPPPTPRNFLDFLPLIESSLFRSTGISLPVFESSLVP